MSGGGGVGFPPGESHAEKGTPMRAVVQRVTQAGVTVEGKVTGAIEKGLLVLLGVGHDDTDETARALAAKIARLRIFGDEAGKMNLSVQQVGGSVLAVSQFTLLADTRKTADKRSVIGNPPVSMKLDKICEYQ